MAWYELEQPGLVRAIGREVADNGILAAFSKVPRHEFMPDDMQHLAYLDEAAPIGEGQTISQPSLIALMIKSLRLSGQERILEVGSGSGYAAAILSRLSRAVFGVERIGKLARKARHTLVKLGYHNVQIVTGDGRLGLPQLALFDAIMVSAAAIEPPQALIDQLAERGRIVIPVHENPESNVQRLRLGTKRNGSMVWEDLGGVRFVPLVGEATPRPAARKNT